MSVSFRRRVCLILDIWHLCPMSSRHLVYITTAHMSLHLFHFFPSFWAPQCGLRKERMMFGTGSVPYGLRQSHDRPTRGCRPRKASLVLVSPHIAPLIIRSPQPCSIRLAPHFSPLHGYIEVLCSAAKRGGPFPHTLRRSRRTHCFYCVRFPLACHNPLP
jgi:hypothetical protein